MSEKFCDSSEERLVSGREVVRRLDCEELDIPEQGKLVEEMREGIAQRLTPAIASASSR